MNCLNIHKKILARKVSAPTQNRKALCGQDLFFAFSRHGFAFISLLLHTVRKSTFCTSHMNNLT